MNKMAAIEQVYRITTLTEPTDEIRSLLGGQEFNRVLELLLMLRMSTRPVRNPAGFLRRAIQEGWKTDTLPQQVDRHTENVEKRLYMNRGLSEDEAQKRVVQGRNTEAWS